MNKQGNRRMCCGSLSSWMSQTALIYNILSCYSLKKVILNQKCFSVLKLFSLQKAEPLCMWSVAVTGQQSVWELYNILESILDQKPEGGRLSSTTCHIGWITRNFHKHMREQLSTKGSQPTYCWKEKWHSMNIKEQNYWLRALN